ncbi:hypothetical protein GCM10023147_28340 [Tsukamurella soli]|uniref:Uncharacterized protein n=2 Tax=Tsukamurella soli TaxID=644556 RepID=A0ABP8JS74_9ACTN
MVSSSRPVTPWFSVAYAWVPSRVPTEVPVWTTQADLVGYVRRGGEIQVWCERERYGVGIMTDDVGREVLRAHEFGVWNNCLDCLPLHEDGGQGFLAAPQVCDA